MPDCTLAIRIKPNAKRDEVEMTETGNIQIRVKALPVDGKANAALIKLLAEKLGLPKSNLSIKRGEASKNKIIAVYGLSKETAVKKLTEIA